MKYPLSYMIYSRQMAALPAEAKQQIVTWLRQILRGDDTSEKFKHWSKTDRQVVREILEATWPVWNS